MDNRSIQKKRPDQKKKLIRTQSESKRLRYIITIAVILIIAIVYYFVDSRSYLATVAGNRITTYEYKFLLTQQVRSTEEDEGISDKTADEKTAYWTKTEGGQNPWETAKNDSLNAAKEYMIQLIKAREMGLSVDNNIRSEVNSFLTSYQADASDQTFASWIKTYTGVTVDQYRKILENAKLIEKFRTAYITQNYKADTVTEDDLKAVYESDRKLFDQVDLRYVRLAKTDDSLVALSEEEVTKKRATAQEALGKLRSGETIDNVIKAYSEDKPSEEDPDEPVGAATIAYNTTYNDQDIVEFAFNNNVGEAEVLETDYDIFVIFIADRTSFEDVKSTVSDYHKLDFYTKALNSWKVDTKYNITVNDGVYDAIKYATLFPNG
jgi:foldase protein PrsA